MSHFTPPQTPPAPAVSSRLTSRLIPATTIVIAVVVVAAAKLLEVMDLVPPAEAFLSRLAMVALAVIVIFLWFVLWGPASPAFRKRMAIGAALGLAAFVGLFAIDNVTGDVVPHLRLRWARRADERLPNVSGQAPAETAVDLAQTTPEDAPQFLGRERTANYPDVGFERDWAAHPPKLLWRQPIGAGWSSFAVVGHFGVTQEQRGEDELITCYDIDNGKLEWAEATPVRFSEVVAGIGPRATPTIDGGKVYAMGAKGDVTCLDGATGKRIWYHDVIAENDAAVPVWGKSCSPLIHNNLVIVSAGGPDGHSLVAYEKESGSMVWSAGDDTSSYSSPTLMTLCGQPLIVILNQHLVTAHSPEDGHIVWEHPWPEPAAEAPNVSQPLAVGEDRILMSKGYGIGSALWQIKHEGDTWSVDVLWKNRNLKTKFTNAVVRDGFAYGLDENVLTCIDVASGKRQWLSGRYNHGQVLLVGDLLLVQSETGDVALVKATLERYGELTRFAAVNGQSWNYPVLVGRKLLVRTEQEAACYELPITSP